MKKIFIIWLLLSKHSLVTNLSSPKLVFIFILAKCTRYGLFVFFLSRLFNLSQGNQYYTPSELLVFFLVFSLIDTTAQIFFREVYRFRPLLQSGNFDHVLLRPYPPLLRVLLGGPDPLDMIMLVLQFLILIIYVVSNFSTSPLDWILWLFMTFFSLILVASFHIIILATALFIQTIDHTIMLYRDITTMARIPTDSYPGFLRLIFVTIIPLTPIFSLPSLVLIGKSIPLLFLYIFLLCPIFLFFSYKFWNLSLRHYQSAA